MDEKSFEEKIYALVAGIPPGQVASYGQLAVLAGGPRWARKAGRAMKNAPPGLPAHRVVNSAGRCVPGWTEQPILLRAEGVTFHPGGHVNMKRHRFCPFG